MSRQSSVALDQRTILYILWVSLASELRGTPFVTHHSETFTCYRWKKYLDLVEAGEGAKGKQLDVDFLEKVR